MHQAASAWFSSLSVSRWKHFSRKATAIYYWYKFPGHPRSQQRPRRTFRVPEKTFIVWISCALVHYSGERGIKLPARDPAVTRHRGARYLLDATTLEAVTGSTTRKLYWDLWFSRLKVLSYAHCTHVTSALMTEKGYLKRWVQGGGSVIRFDIQ